MNLEMKGKSISECSSLSHTRNRNMTMLINAKNTNKIIIASDSWNHFSGEDDINKHYIQKIFYNKKFPFIIGQAGENSKLYINKVVYLSDFIQKTCDMYNGYNGKECINYLLIESVNYLKDLSLGNVDERFIQYFIAFYNFSNNRIENINFDISKNAFEIKKKTINKLNACFCSFGIYDFIINKKYSHINLNRFSDNELETKILDEFKWCITTDRESSLLIDDKSVEGPIQWAEIHNDGTLVYKVIDI